MGSMSTNERGNVAASSCEVLHGLAVESKARGLQKHYIEG